MEGGVPCWYFKQCKIWFRRRPWCSFHSVEGSLTFPGKIRDSPVHFLQISFSKFVKQNSNANNKRIIAVIPTTFCVMSTYKLARCLFSSQQYRLRQIIMIPRCMDDKIPFCSMTGTLSEVCRDKSFSKCEQSFCCSNNVTLKRPQWRIQDSPVWGRTPTENCMTTKKIGSATGIVSKNAWRHYFIFKDSFTNHTLQFWLQFLCFPINDMCLWGAIYQS